MKIAFFSSKNYDQISFDHSNKAFGNEIVYFKETLSESSAILAQGAEAVCIFVNDKITAQVIGLLSIMGIKVIALRCAGFNNVDLVAAAAAKIAVVRVPAYSPHAVAEFVVGLILTLNRKIHKAYNRVREGNFSLDRLVGFDLFQKNVGVIGTGKIGQVFANIMLGFGCHILAYDIFKNPLLESAGVEYLPMDDLLARSDIISLHCPLTKESHHLINEQSLAKVKDGAMLINAGRGALIDTAAVMEALKTGKLCALAMDVYEQEESLFFQDLSEQVIKDDVIMRLMSFPNVLVTSHQAFLTREALNEIAQVTLQSIQEFSQNKPLVNAVLPS